MAAPVPDEKQENRIEDWDRAETGLAFLKGALEEANWPDEDEEKEQRCVQAVPRSLAYVVGYQGTPPNRVRSETAAKMRLLPIARTRMAGPSLWSSACATECMAGARCRQASIGLRPT